MREKSRSELLYNCSEFNHQNDEWVPFPIGMGWTLIHSSSLLPEIQCGKHTNLVLCAINPDTDQRRRGSSPLHRRRILETLRKNGIQNTYIHGPSYFKTLPTYKFIISPEGNGIDCHRHYEALMAGCIPIMEDHPGIREKYKGCPILYTKDYSEITPDYLEKVYTEMADKEYDFSRLLLSSYSTEEQTQIRENGNYWGHRLSGKKWYTT
jgi:hypothetical protein